MPGRNFNGSWALMKLAVPDYWPRVTAEDVARLAGDREELMRLLKERYGKSYGAIDREVTEFELREVRAAYAARPSSGIGPD